MARKTQAEAWGESIVDYTRPKEELAKELAKIRQATVRRSAQIHRKGEYSYAGKALADRLSKSYLAVALKRNSEDDKELITKNIAGALPDIGAMSVNDIKHELAVFHFFWAAQSSTYRGAKEIRKNISGRIYGVTPGGNPKELIPTKELRVMFALYDEFLNANPGNTARYDSNRVQMLARELTAGVKNKEDLDLAALMADMKKRLDEEFNVPDEESAHILSSKPVFKGGKNSYGK